MNRLSTEILTNFKSIVIPRYIVGNIQSIALGHLKLKDMGQLRDRLDGAAYYKKIYTNICMEFTFEKLIGIKAFDWEKRKPKSYKNGIYLTKNKKIRLINISSTIRPKVNALDFDAFVFVKVIPDSKCYISGVCTIELLKKFGKEDNNGIFYFDRFELLKIPNSQDELETILN